MFRKTALFAIRRTALFAIMFRRTALFKLKPEPELCRYIQETWLYQKKLILMSWHRPQKTSMEHNARQICVEAGMIALRRNGNIIMHDDFLDAILEIQSRKKTVLNYYA